MPSIKMLTFRGDEQIAWDPADPASVEAARARFAELRSKGWLVWRRGQDGSTGEQVHEFDPACADGYVASSPMAGG